MKQHIVGRIVSIHKILWWIIDELANWYFSFSFNILIGWVANLDDDIGLEDLRGERNLVELNLIHENLSKFCFH